MHLTGDNLLIKKINRNVVLEIIRWHSPISRTEVNRLSGLNKGTVSTIVNDLIEDNLVHETGSGKSSGGRKPVMLTFNNLAGYAIEINVEINQISGILTDLNGSVRKSMNVFPEAISFNHVYQRLEYIIATLLSATPDSEYGVVGIGIGFPGTVNADGRVQIAPTLGWRDIPLEEILQTRFNLPITVSNEAKVGAQGEFAYGAGKNSTDLLYLSISHGIGSSIMINKKFYKGHQGYSGDVGHTTFDIRGKQCDCGNIGCWQHYASVNALLKEARQLPNVANLLNDSDQSSENLDHIVSLAEKGDEATIELIERIGENIGIGLSNLIHTLNPELVIIGGKITKFTKWIKRPIDQAIKKRAKLYYENNIKIEYSQLGDDSIILGAAHIGISQLFKETKVTIN